MFAVFALAPVSQTQSSGLPWWFWLLLLVIVILAFILWQRRSQTRKASPAEVKAPEPLPTVEAPPLPEAAAEAVDAVKAVAGEAAAKAAAVAAPLAEAVAAVAAPKRAAQAWKSSTWRTREWQPQPPTWYPKWDYRIRRRA
jgi:hypothetical protein